ncbi:MAG: ATP-binding cassette domain-containing protein [Bacteroidales bacterium]|jgi:phospholipid/cholesterol/gamma-HCH transport system ATP-binding protein|nr:ATP-binding cassette domain-containing protein [Bacteroidales bacterium]MDD4001314.1 ATP-binding cassette domain-containing protein [Bacteroidales bacterium]MDD4528770.1 ATP-binding cassette domain-containing protein [Bacteroidales bacterium]MDD4829721.1 ATP-binding cassette domain-containing protein [Bacteroidales bacterium]
MVELVNVSKSFDGKQILKNINIKFAQGKCNLIIGLSGSGKTVLMKTLVGLHLPEQGDVLYGGNAFNKMSVEEQINVRKYIGMVFQGGALFDSMTIEENVMYPIRMFQKSSYHEMLDKVNFSLERVNLKGVNKMMPSEISGGMKKRVAIARAIAAKPKYLFCDEPNSGLDPQTSILIDELIYDITHEFNITTIVNTHDMNSVVEIGEQIYYIHKGELWWQGDNKNVLSSTNKELNDFIFCTALTKKIKQQSENK